MSSNVSLLIQTNSLSGVRCEGWSRLPQRVQSMFAKRCGERASQRLVVEQTALLAEGRTYGLAYTLYWGFREGRAIPPSAPGLGIEWKRAIAQSPARCPVAPRIEATSL